MSSLRLPRLHATLTALLGDGTSGARRFFQRRQHDLVGVRKSGLLARERADTHALLDARAAVLHDAVFQCPGLFPRQLKIHVSEIHRVPEHFAEYAIEASVVEPARTQDQLTCDP